MTAVWRMCEREKSIVASRCLNVVKETERRVSFEPVKVTVVSVSCKEEGFG